MPMETMTEAISRLERAGYVESFIAESGRVRCAACEGWHEATELTIDEVVRFEGASDPADEAVLFALACRHCDVRGTYVAAYGPSTSAADVEMIKKLIDPPQT